jgi:hypothetical protein
VSRRGGLLDKFFKQKFEINIFFLTRKVERCGNQRAQVEKRQKNISKKCCLIKGGNLSGGRQFSSILPVHLKSDLIKGSGP